MAGKLVDDSALGRFLANIKAYFKAGSNITISNGTISGNYQNATTSASGLMSATDKTAVNKIGTGTLNTTNKTLIPAVNELAALGRIAEVGNGYIRFAGASKVQICWGTLSVGSSNNSAATKDGTATFAKSFSTVPTVICSASSGAKSTYGYKYSASVKSRTVSSCVLTWWMTENTDYGPNNIYWLAIGSYA